MKQESMPDYYRYWGKAKKDPDAQGSDYHLLVYHSLDVAAVCWHLLDIERPLCKSLAKQLAIDPKWLRHWFTFCAMLHDIGKFARSFQNLVPNLSSELVPKQVGLNTRHRHDTLGYSLWQQHLRSYFSELNPEQKIPLVTNRWLAIVCGHHGKPPQEIGTPDTSLVPAEDIPSAQTFLKDINKFWSPELTPLSEINKKQFKKVSWHLSGVAVLADWLGSDQQVFEYVTQPMPLEQYWNDIALPQAEKILDKSEFREKPITPFSSIRQQFDFIHQPTPLQQWAQEVQLPQNPQLFILEDVTGAGKTEAAMVLAHRLLSKGLAQGLYVGLPTMATANGMYNRLSKSYQALFKGKSKASLVLAHGACQLSKSFQESIKLTEQLNDLNYAKGDQSASAYCNQWLADNRKKALLADVGIGTIDQALFAVLPARHQSLRLLGLKNKILILDEIHAYDPYMRQLLAALLQVHAEHGGSVILLSATLPHQFRKELLDAYLQGRGLPLQQLKETKAYPLVSHTCDQGVKEIPVATRASIKRSVRVERVNDTDEAIELIINAVKQSLCICWVRNTIKDARSSYQQLSGNSRIDQDKLTLFHSRFAMIDRQAVESDVLNRFGKASTTQQRAGQVLIATQVVEQSLDLDFDLMISDLAPIDLLIQRAGRLQRHVRDQQGNPQDGSQAEQRQSPCLYLLSPAPETIQSEQWLQSVLPATQKVYPNIGQLWLTARSLLKKQGFTMPEDARGLIESVYGEQAQDEIPELLQQQSDEAIGEDRAKKSQGNFIRLDFEKGYSLESGGTVNGWDEDTRIPTRLNEVETITVALAVAGEQANDLQPWAKSEMPNHNWRLSQLQLPVHEWEQAQALIPESWVPVIEQLKQKFSYLKYVHILPLVAETAHLYQAQGGWDLQRKPC